MDEEEMKNLGLLGGFDLDIGEEGEAELEEYGDESGSGADGKDSGDAPDGDYEDGEQPTKVAKTD